jgi:hypothetical protein
MGFLCGGETWTRVSPPIPLSSANAMAKGAPKPTGAAPKAPGTTGATVAQPAPAAPKAAGTAKPGQKGAADQVGDICLLPEIAGFAH